MAAFGQVLLATVEFLKTELTFDGFTFSLWQLFLWGIVVSGIVYVVAKWVSDD